LSSVDILRTRGRGFFRCEHPDFDKNFGFFEIYGASTRGINFSDSCGRLYGRPHTERRRAYKYKVKNKS